MPDVQLVEEFFDKESYNEILSYLNNYLKYTPSGWDDTFVRNYYHNLPFFVDIHHQLQEVASFYFKEKVKPSYSFLSLYKPGGTCPLHIDRDQCRYTIDYLIQTDEVDSWEISISDVITDKERAERLLNNSCVPSDEDAQNILQRNFTSVSLVPNSAVLYSGTHQWHYRPKKLTSTSDLVFFHFVPEDFNRELD